MVAPQFINVGGTSKSISIDQIKPQGEDLYNNVSLNTFDAFGFTVDTYVWTDCGGEDWDQVDVWVDGDNNVVTGIDFAAGEGLWVGGSAAGQYLQSAGEVNLEDVSIQLQSGFTLGGNSFPTTVNIADIYPTGDDLYNNVSLNTFDEFGFTVDTYVWTDCGGEDWDQVDVWVDGDNNVITDVNFAPGAGLWIGGSSDAQYLNIPAPEL